MTTEATNPAPASFEDAIKRLEAMHAEAVTDRADFAAWFQAELVTSRQCPKHGEETERDFEASYRLSKQHGDRRLAFKPCPTCQLERTNALASEWLAKAGVPKLYVLESFDTYQPETDKERVNLGACRAYAQEAKGFLLMQGDTGTGKTHLCVSILRAFKGGRYRTHETMLAGLRATYGDRGAAASFEKMKNSSLLVWDEFGVSVGGGDEPMMIHSILNHRYENRLPTVIATNLQIPALKAAIGERIESRMRQALAHKLTFDGRDRRNDMKAKYLIGD